MSDALHEPDSVLSATRIDCRCPHCLAFYRLPLEHLGRLGKCRCGRCFQVEPARFAQEESEPTLPLPQPHPTTAEPREIMPVQAILRPLLGASRPYTIRPNRRGRDSLIGWMRCRPRGRSVDSRPRNGDIHHYCIFVSAKSLACWLSGQPVKAKPGENETGSLLIS